MIQKRVTEYVKRMFNNKLIDQKTKQYLVQNDPRPGRFYILPKIHKLNNPGRPIVSSNNHPTERISQFVDYYLKPLVCTVPSYVKDTTDFLNKLANLNTINTLPDNAILVTLDVTSLYTNIPHREGIPGGYSQKKWVGVCGPLPKTLTLFMSSLQANLRPKSAIFPTLFMSY